MREYDIALSFAGEDREYADKIAKKLRESNVKVFYDKFNTSILWGKDLYQYLSDVYRNKAEYCVVFVSKYYMEKTWTRHELRNAQSRAFTENKEYILPIRLDDSSIPGLNDTIGYIDSNNFTIDEIVQLLKEKLLSCSNVFSDCTTLERLLKCAIDKIFEISEAELNQICLETLFDQHTSRLFVFVDIIEKKEYRYNIISMEGVIGKAFKSGEIICIQNTLGNNLFIKTKINSMSELAIPIKIQGNVIGVINIESCKSNFFSEEKKNSLKLIADYLGNQLEILGYHLDYRLNIPIIYNEF